MVALLVQPSLFAQEPVVQFPSGNVHDPNIMMEAAELHTLRYGTYASNKSSQGMVEDSMIWWRLDTSLMYWKPVWKYVLEDHNQDNLPLSTYEFEWDGMSWTPTIFFARTYDTAQHMLTELRQVWNGSWENEGLRQLTWSGNYLTYDLYQVWSGGAWINDVQVTYTYDPNNNQLSRHFEAWDGMAWVNDQLRLMTYDGSSNLLTDMIQMWNGNYWENSDRMEYTYDARNNRTSYLQQRGTDTTWENNMLNSYTFSGDDLLTLEIRQYWINSAWENYSRETLTYDTNRNLKVKFRESWTGTLWQNQMNWEYFYDANNNDIHHLLKDWVGNQWENEYQVFSEYDSNSQLTEFRTERWRGGPWRSEDLYRYNYDAGNNWVMWLYRRYDTTGTTITHSDSIYHYFGVHSAVLPGPVSSPVISVAPNPTNGELLIVSPDLMINRIVVYDMGGSRVYQAPISRHRFELDLSGMRPGAYSLVMETGSGVFMKKIVVW